MALFKISKGQAANLPTKYNEGWCYFTTDDGKFYIDTSGTGGTTGTRIAINANNADHVAWSGITNIPTLVYSVATGSTNGTISVNQGGTTSNVAVKGLAAAAYKGVTDNSSAAAVSTSDTNLITGRTLANAGYVKTSGVTSITLKAGTGISLDTDNTEITSSGTRTITNAGVREVKTGSSNGTISVNTGGTIADVAVKGLGSNAYTSTAYIPTANRDAANGVAPLDENKKVPAANLPSYVDDVLEYNALANFPATGTGGIIYLAKDTGFIYRWTGSQYVNVSADTNTTYTIAPGDSNGYIKVTPSAGTAYGVLVTGGPFLPLAGGTVTGETTFNDAVLINDELSADSASIGNLLVTGAANFTNGITGNLTGSVTGTASGNLTNVSYSNNKIQKTINGTTSTIATWSVGILPTLATESIACDDITAWSAGAAASATYSQGVLTFTNGTAPSLSYNGKTVNSVSNWSTGTLPSLT